MVSLVEKHGPFLRVDEAARLLRISRTSGYALANQWLASGGLQGLPAIRIGRSIRVPTLVVERLATPGNAVPRPELDPPQEALAD